MAKFIILRNAARRSTASGFEAFGIGAQEVAAAAPPEPHIETHDMSVADAVSAARDPGVAAIAIPMPIKLIKPFDVEAGAAAANAWGIGAVKADTSPMSGDGVVVAVLDTGIDKAHPAFAGVTIVEQDFSGSGNGDRQGHGTHCAGTIFGRDVGGQRIGVARGVKKALIGKVLTDTGGGSSQMIFEGIQWAVNNGAHVISMSLGFDFPGSVKRMEQAGLPTEPAVSNALEAYRSNLRMFDALMAMVKARAMFADTAVVVAATGNEANRPTFKINASLPAAAEGVVSVAALSQAPGNLFDIATFSNAMPQVAAPGVDILSAKNGGGLTSKSGTSMACPHAAGIAALWWEKFRKDGLVKPTASLVASQLMTSARANVFTSAVVPDDRGSGIVTAPQ